MTLAQLTVLMQEHNHVPAHQGVTYEDALKMGIPVEYNRLDDD